MRYSIWSKGRLVGHTDLEFIYRKNGFRMGWFYPNELGERLMPMATGISPAMHASVEAGKNVLRDPDVISAFRYAYALELELRKADGKKIETSYVAITDTEFLQSIAYSAEDSDSSEQVDLERGKDAAFDLDDEDWLTSDEPDEPWREREEAPRYQILIFLVEHHAAL